MMKKRILSLLTALCLLLCAAPTSAFAAGKITGNLSRSEDATWESEHPPLSETTKKAIAAYKKNPTEENKQGILNALNETYDWVVQNKKNNLLEYTNTRTKRIDAWMRTILNGGMPPFMSLSSDNNKGGERQALADAVDTYRENSSTYNRALVRQALEAYYDVFLREQEEHINETEELRETRIAASLEYFTSDRFKPQVNITNTVKQEDALAEIICAYISVGAKVVPVNPEARVREREINAAISSAQTVYLNVPTEENKTKLQEEIANAFQTAYDVRLEEYAIAENKGSGGADALFTQMLDADFRSTKFQELTEQLNLYGRIDRMVTYGSNTYGDWTPRMETESQELAVLLNEYEAAPTSENELAVKDKFYEIYDNMLIVQKAHLEETQTKLSSFTEETLLTLID